MKKLIFIFSFLLTALLSNAQINFQKTYSISGGTWWLSGCNTSDGNYVFASEVYASGLNGMYLIKVNNLGDTLWTKKYELGNSYFLPFSIKESIDKKLMIAGYTNYSTPYTDSFFMNTDSMGNPAWLKIIDYLGLNDKGYETVATSDSGYILLGHCRFFPGEGTYVIKTDKNGNFIWNKIYNYLIEIDGKSIQETSDGGYIICGFHRDDGVVAGKIYLLKIDSLGNVIWSKYYKHNSTATYGTANYVRQTLDGGYILGGGYLGGLNSSVFLLKTDSNGAVSWWKVFNTIDEDYVGYLEVTKDSGYIMVGRTGPLGPSYFFAIKTDVNGDTLWTRNYGIAAGDFAYYAHQTIDNGFIIGGYSNSSMYLIKTDSLGNSNCNSSNGAFTMIDSIGSAFNASVSVQSVVWNVIDTFALISSGGIVNILCSNVGIISKFNFQNSFSIFPNPSSGNCTVTFSDFILDGIIEFYNILGEKFYSEKIKNEQKKVINLKNISDGIYFVRLFDGEKMFNQKIIVE